MSTFELAAKIKELKELETFIKQAQGEIESIKDSIKQVMTEKGVNEMCVDVYTIRNKLVNSTRLDGKRLSADFPEIAKKYTVVSSCVRFSVA